MEKFTLTVPSGLELEKYPAGNFIMHPERAIFEDIAEAVATADESQLTWFTQFGDSVRQMIMNVNDYRHGLNFKIP